MLAVRAMGLGARAAARVWWRIRPCDADFACGRAEALTSGRGSRCTKGVNKAGLGSKWAFGLRLHQHLQGGCAVSAALGNLRRKVLKSQRLWARAETAGARVATVDTLNG